MYMRACRVPTLRLQNFKTFEDFTIHLDRANVLVGINNAGKSTRLDAFRALSGGLRVAAQRRAGLLELDKQGFHIGYHVPLTLLPITIKNIHTDYRAEDAILTFTLTNKRSLKLLFPADGGCRLVLDDGLHEVSTVRKFQLLYPVAINVILTLGPFEANENLTL